MKKSDASHICITYTIVVQTNPASQFFSTRNGDCNKKYAKKIEKKPFVYYFNLLLLGLASIAWISSFVVQCASVPGWKGWPSKVVPDPSIQKRMAARAGEVYLMRHTFAQQHQRHSFVQRHIFFSVFLLAAAGKPSFNFSSLSCLRLFCHLTWTNHPNYTNHLSKLDITHTHLAISANFSILSNMSIQEAMENFVFPDNLYGMLIFCQMV